MNLFQFSDDSIFTINLDNEYISATAKRIRAGVGDNYRYNAGLQKALLSLEYQKSSDVNSSIVGVTGVWEGLPIIINLQRLLK